MPPLAVRATAACVGPRKYQLMAAMSTAAVAAMPQSSGVMSGLPHQLETGALDSVPDHIVRHLSVEAQRCLTDLDLERFDAGNGFEHARQAVDAAATRHALDDECLVDLGHVEHLVFHNIPLPPICQPGLGSSPWSAVRGRKLERHGQKARCEVIESDLSVSTPSLAWARGGASPARPPQRLH